MSDRLKSKMCSVGSLLLIAVGSVAVSTGCGDEAAFSASEDAEPGENDGEGAAEDGDRAGENADNDAGDEFIPEEEEFLVEHVAATDHHVFVPNQSDESDTVALIDGRDFSVRPIQVGLQPVQVRAADVEGQGSVGYVLSTGEPTVSVVRADVIDNSGNVAVDLLPVPGEVNALEMAPDGRHLIAYIDPDEPINESGSTISLQTMALIRLGDERGDDEVFQLSVTRNIDTIAFSDDGERAFVVGQEGINQIVFDDIKDDTFIPTLQLGMVDSVFPPSDQQVVVSSDGSTLAMRTSNFEGVGVFELQEDQAPIEDHRVIDLDAIPTDLEMVEAADGSLRAVVAIRSTDQVAVFDVDDALLADEGDQDFLEVYELAGTDVGSVRMMPGNEAMVLYSTVPLLPQLGLFELGSGDVEGPSLRNEIRSLDISPDGNTVVAVHQRQQGSASTADPREQFRHREGLTLWDLETGFVRPISLHGVPEEIVMASDGDGNTYLFVMLVSSSDSGSTDQGVKRIDLQTHATKFVGLARTPTQLGAVADQIFVSQEQETGRITFFDIETNQQRTVSGYELNAGIE